MKYRQLMTPKNAKVGIFAAAALTLMYVVLIQGDRNVEADRAVRASEGIEYTTRQAENMTQAADEVSVLLEDTVASPSIGGMSNQTKGKPIGVEDTPQQELDQETVQTWYSDRINELNRRWSPRYRTAIRDIETFEHRFRTTRARLEEYFDQQTAMTDSISNPSLREDLKVRDHEERQAYDLWLQEGERVVTQASRMRRDLTDMDTIIRKQLLTVGMLGEFSQVRSIPESVKNLHDSLDIFRSQSDELAHDLSVNVFSER